MALLNQGLGSMGAGGQDASQLLQMLSMAKSDPFSRPLPGSNLLGEGQLSMPQSLQGVANQQSGMGMQQMPNMERISTDFADTQPGLPNLPDSFQGFGYGQFAPKENPGNIRQQMIMQMLQQLLPQMQGGMGGGNLGFGGF